MVHSRKFAEGALIVEAAIAGLYPVLTNIASTQFPPIFFVGASVVIAFVSLLVYCVATGTLRSGFDMSAFPFAAGVACLVLTGFVLITIGSKYTSGINTALLLQNEMLVAFLVSTFLLHEHISRRQLTGMFGIFIGTLCIIFNGKAALNMGDLLILGTTVLFPFANILAKKGLAHTSPTIFLLMRYLVGAVLLTVLSFLLEDPLTVLQTMDARGMQLIAIYGVLILTVSKILWYTGLHILPLGITTYIGSTSPIFSLVFAFLLLGELPTGYQWAGFFLTAAGVYLLIARAKPSPTPAHLV